MKLTYFINKLKQINMTEESLACAKFSFVISFIYFSIMFWINYFYDFKLSKSIIFCGYMIVVPVIAINYYLISLDLKKIVLYLNNLTFRRDVKPPVLTSKFSKQVEKSLNLLNETWNSAQKDLAIKIEESKHLFSSLPDGIVILDESLLIHKANDAAHDFLGSSLIGRQITSVINDKKLSGILYLSLHEKKGKKIQIVIESNVTKTFLIKIEPMIFNDSSQIYLLLVMDDITEIMQIEKSFSDFVTNASHEIRTPLTSIIGVAETLTNNKDPEAYDLFLPVIFTQANRMKQLINDLLNLASIERQINSRPSQIIRVQELLDEVSRQCDWDLKQNSNKLIVNMAKSTPRIVGDFNQLIQVLYNLITNAIKYGKAGKDIVVNISKVKALPNKFSKLIDSEKFIIISVIDQGEGIEPLNLVRLTEKFFRIDSSRSRKVQGVGLGLSIVKQIIIRHGGFLDIKSKLGEGSEFVVYLPKYRASK